MTFQWNKFKLGDEDHYEQISGATSNILSTTYQEGYYYSCITNSNEKTIIKESGSSLGDVISNYNNFIITHDKNMTIEKDVILDGQLYDIYGNKLYMSNYSYKWFYEGAYDTTLSSKKTFTVEKSDSDVVIGCESFNTKEEFSLVTYFYIYADKSDISGFEEERTDFYLCKGNTLSHPYISTGKVTYSSSNTNVVTIDKDGTINAVGEGVADIRTYVNGSEEENGAYIVVVRNHKAVTDAETSTLSSGTHCKICGKVLTAQTAKVTQTVSTPVLKVGDTTTATNGATVTLLSNTTVALKNKTVLSKQVIVPGSVIVDGKEYKVTTIKRDCFNGATVIRASLPTSITKIAYKAFAGDKKLRVLNINSKKLTVSKDAFKGLKKSQVKKIKVTVCKKFMKKSNYKKLRKQLIKAGIKAKNIQYR